MPNHCIGAAVVYGAERRGYIAGSYMLVLHSVIRVPGASTVCKDQVIARDGVCTWTAAFWRCREAWNWS